MKHRAQINGNLLPTGSPVETEYSAGRSVSRWVLRGRIEEAREGEKVNRHRYLSCRRRLTSAKS